MFFCYYCKQAIVDEKNPVTLIPFHITTKISQSDEVRAHKKCWQKDLDSDSGNYFDNFVDR